MAASGLSAPIAAHERIPAMDVIRGFALLGILLMNIEGLVGPTNVALTGVDPALSGLDRWVDAGIYILVQGKFYALFSLLFGMGFAVMMSRAHDAGRPFVPVYLRRTFALLVIGLVHATLVWSGDILTSYALLALLLLWLFRTTATSRLPWWGIALYVVPSLAVLGLGLLGSLMQLIPEVATEFDKAMVEGANDRMAQVEAQRRAYGSGSYLDATWQRGRDLVSMMGYLILVGWQILGLFVLGGWFVRSGAIARPQTFPRLFANLRWLGLPIGLVLMLVSYYLMPAMDPGRLDFTSGAATALTMLGSLLMSLGYLAWLVRGLQSPVMARALAVLAPAGRMALTNYLLQSLICTWIFYGYGLGYFEGLSRAWQVPFVVAFFAAQLWLSRWWMARFHFGPIEWLWRAVSYGKRPLMRQAGAVAKGEAGTVL